MAWNSVFQCHELTQEILLDLAVFGHVGAGFASRQDAQEGDHEHFVKVVTGGVAAPGIRYIPENTGKFLHGSASCCVF